MPSLGILFVALIAVISSLNIAESSSRGFDLDKVLGHLQQESLHERSNKQRKQRFIDSSSSSSSSDSESDSKSDSDTDSDDDSMKRTKSKLGNDKFRKLIRLIANENNINGRLLFRNGQRKSVRSLGRSDDLIKSDLTKKEIIDLIDRVLYEKKSNDRNIKSDYKTESETYDYNQSSRKEVEKQIMEKLFSKSFNDEENQSKQEGDGTKKRLKPNRLIPSTITMNDVKKFNEHKNDKRNLEEYSKVYIVLNPQAVPKIRKKNSLFDIVSKLLAMTSPTLGLDLRASGRPRYKGFVLNENFVKRRFRDENDNLDEPNFVAMQRATFAPYLNSNES